MTTTTICWTYKRDTIRTLIRYRDSVDEWAFGVDGLGLWLLVQTSALSAGNNTSSITWPGY